MALPSFLQAMFTPQRPGPGQMAWRDIVNEDSGEFSTGDMQEMYWKPSAVTSRSISGPTTRRLPDPLPGTGGGPNPLAQIGRDMGELAGDGGEDMTSITGAMKTGRDPWSQVTPVGDEFGGAPAMSYATPSDPMGGGLDRMLGDSRFGGGAQPSYSMRDEFAEEGPGMFSQAIAVQDLFTPQSSGDPSLQGTQVDTSVTSPLFQDPMGSGIGGIRASDQRFTPPMAEDPGVLESIKDKIVGMPAFHLNVADQVGTGGSRSQFKQDRANTLADELAFGASADSRNIEKQPPGFWDFATGGLLKGPSQYMPSAWNIDIPGQVNPGIEAQISEHAQRRKILEDRESMLRADGVPEFKIQQAMGQHYTGPITEGTL